jgi:fatty acid synthase subunit alpha
LYTSNEAFIGKSTLQNELIGEFYNEFSTLPEKPENIPLQDLGAAATAADSDLKLGKTSSALIAKLISSKMPARFNANSIRSHLADKWGLGPSRQIAVLFSAVASEPQSRLPSVQAAEEYFDDVLSKYAETCGITLQVRLHKADENGTAAQVFDPTILAELSKSYKAMASKQFKALAEYLQVDISSHSAMVESEASVDELQKRLDTWTSEFSEDFLAGIAPTFDAMKARRYNSWWNVARQEVLAFYNGPAYESMAQSNHALETFINGVNNRADDRLVTMVRCLAQRAYHDYDSAPEFIAISRRIEDGIVSAVRQPPKARPLLSTNGPRTVITDDGSIEYTEVPRRGFSGPTGYAEFLSKNSLHGRPVKTPFISLKSFHKDVVNTQTDLTAKFLSHMFTALSSGVSFENKTILVTGAGQGSIGAEIVRLLLAGGASVVITTSREPSSVSKYFQKMYEDHGAKSTELRLIQCNQASANDCEQLIDHIYDVLGVDLDAVLPFAAASEGGIEVEAIADKSELTHRLMLVNVFRLLGRIIKNKRHRRIDCHPTQVLLPLSPNHGLFGGDGLYAESKLGLESLFNRVKSESWSDELSICGVKFGWTRSTGLMTANDIVSETVERHGVLTFSAQVSPISHLVLTNY